MPVPATNAPPVSAPGVSLSTMPSANIRPALGPPMSSPSVTVTSNGKSKPGCALIPTHAASARRRCDAIVSTSTSSCVVGALDGERDDLARLVRGDEPDDVLAGRHLLAVDGEDHVAGLELAQRRRALDDRVDEHPLGDGDVELAQRGGDGALLRGHHLLGVAGPHLLRASRRRCRRPRAGRRPPAGRATRAVPRPGTSVWSWLVTETVVRLRLPSVGNVSWPSITITSVPLYAPIVFSVGPGLSTTYGTGKIVDSASKPEQQHRADADA